MSSLSPQVYAVFRALQQVEEDAKQHSIETTTASIAQLIVQLTCIQEVAGSNAAVEQIFFLKINAFCIYVF